MVLKILGLTAILFALLVVAPKEAEATHTFTGVWRVTAVFEGPQILVAPQGDPIGNPLLGAYRNCSTTIVEQSGALSGTISCGELVPALGGSCVLIALALERDVGISIECGPLGEAPLSGSTSGGSLNYVTGPISWQGTRVDDLVSGTWQTGLFSGSWSGQRIQNATVSIGLTEAGPFVANGVDSAPGLISVQVGDVPVKGELITSFTTSPVEGVHVLPERYPPVTDANGEFRASIMSTSVGQVFVQACTADACSGSVAIEFTKQVTPPSPPPDLVTALLQRIDSNPGWWDAGSGMNSSGILYNISRRFQEGPFTCNGYQGLVLTELNLIRLFEPDLLVGEGGTLWDYRPVETAFSVPDPEAPPGTIGPGLHQAVVIYPTGTVWQETGTVIDPWLTQTPQVWTLQDWPVNFLGVQPSYFYSWSPAAGQWQHRDTLSQIGQNQSPQEPAGFQSGQSQPGPAVGFPGTSFSKHLLVRGPVSVRAEDSLGNRVGLLTDGTPVSEFAAGAEMLVVASADGVQVTYLGLPSGQTYSMHFEAYAEGPVNIIIGSDSGGIPQYATYDEFNVIAGQTGSADLTTSNAVLDFKGTQIVPVMSGSLDALEVDTDGDGISDTVEELLYATDPELADTDGDGINDYAEAVTYSCLDPLTDDANADPDSDGITSATELLQGTDPCSAPVPPPPVGGISLNPDLRPLPLETAQSSSPAWAIAVAAAAASLLALGGAAWFTRRRWLRLQ